MPGADAVHHTNNVETEGYQLVVLTSIGEISIHKLLAWNFAT
jgi:hypothetical protein